MIPAKIWKCECGNEDQRKIIIVTDGEVVCAKCETVLGQVKIKSVTEEQIDGWDGEADFCRTLLEEHVSKRGW